MDMRKKISGFFLIGCLFLITSAFTWPWEKEKETPQAEEQVEIKEEEAVKPVFTRPAEPPRSEYIFTKIEPGVTTAAIPTPPRPEDTFTEAKRGVTTGALPPATRPEVLSTQPSVVRDELNRVMQANKIRQAQLEQQMEQVKEVRERTGIYNRMLATVATRKPRSVSAQAVSQERVRVLHEQIRSLSVAQTGKIPALESAAQAKDVAAQASQSGRLPIGKYAPKKE